MKPIRIHQMAMFARDLDEAIAFYRDQLGATYLAKFDPPGLVFFDFSGTRLLLEKTASKGSIYFRVDDIESAYTELLDKGVKFIAEPHLIFRDDNGIFGPAGEEEWMAFFLDPSDNTLALVSRSATKD
jgi:catechol 2,3-dioxygenase-like lactoylglutathione lyase family enzyme